MAARRRSGAGAAPALDDEGLKRKIAAVEAGLALHAAHLNDPLEVLRRLGGREIAAICGAIIAARLQRIPVILDGYVVTAAAAVLHALEPSVDRPLPRRPSLGRGRASRGPGAARQAAAAGARHAAGRGDGRGARRRLVKAAAAIHSGMATFAQAGVAGKGEG